MLSITCAYDCCIIRFCICSCCTTSKASPSFASPESYAICWLGSPSRYWSSTRIMICPSACRLRFTDFDLGMGFASIAFRRASASSASFFFFSSRSRRRSSFSRRRRSRSARRSSRSVFGSAGGSGAASAAAAAGGSSSLVVVVRVSLAVPCACPFFVDLDPDGCFALDVGAEDCFCAFFPLSWLRASWNSSSSLLLLLLEELSLSLSLSSSAIGASVDGSFVNPYAGFAPESGPSKSGFPFEDFDFFADPFVASFSL
mmetsp:Transcript_4258/g.10357  ORF Transcript_4258/g.10357 Transcript_4258/m.10357 type:complete len:258 (+) Transcript_4258:2904-3677(+)